MFPHLSRAGNRSREMMPMSEYVHGDRRSRLAAESKTIESRALFAACFVLFLFRAVAVRVMPWRKRQQTGTQSPRPNGKESIFSEAGTAARMCVTSSFMGL